MQLDKNSFCEFHRNFGHKINLTALSVIWAPVSWDHVRLNNMSKMHANNLGLNIHDDDDNCGDMMTTTAFYCVKKTRLFLMKKPNPMGFIRFYWFILGFS